MSGQEGSQIPYWFWQGFGLIIFGLCGQLIIKWIDSKFFQKEDKWSGSERRKTIEIDEKFLVEFLETYKRHVSFVELLVKNSKEFSDRFQEHDDKETRNQKLIREIHTEVTQED